MEEKWSMLSLTFRWPHEAVILGFELIPPGEDENYNTVRIHLILMTINYDFGWGESPY
tara:strand:+ start:3080 stop:3253 length:174 start_codon:yes stop_codon:yes gene_type:complete